MTRARRVAPKNRWRRRNVDSEKWTWYVRASWRSTRTVDPLPANSLKNALIYGFPMEGVDDKEERLVEEAL